jgi:hypothetical protein
MRKRTVLISALVAGLALLAMGVTALGQDGTAVVEPEVGLLASAAGLAVVIGVFMNVIRSVFPSDFAFDRWAPAIAVLLGVLGSFAYVFTTGDPVNGAVIIQAGLIGVFAGWQSQNVNTILTRTTGDVN